MGANAQTTVPKYTALTVLPAASMNISAGTGIPVFATTVTRDAAFGGANKVLAEGQTCYLESTNVVQYYDGAAWATVGPSTAGGKLLQVVTGTTTTSISTSLETYVDTTLTATITPTLASSTILVFITHPSCSKSSGNVDNRIFMRLFRDATEILSVADGVGYTNSTLVSYFAIAASYRDSPASTSALVYKTTFANGTVAASVTVQHGSIASQIVLMEIAA